MLFPSCVLHVDLVLQVFPFCPLVTVSLFVSLSVCVTLFPCVVVKLSNISDPLSCLLIFTKR